VTLQCETTTGVILTKNFNYNNDKFSLPEDLAKQTAYGLLDEIFTGGVVDATNQSTALLLMALSSGDNISCIKLARITQ